MRAGGWAAIIGNLGGLREAGKICARPSMDARLRAVLHLESGPFFCSRLCVYASNLSISRNRALAFMIPKMRKDAQHEFLQVGSKKRAGPIASGPLNTNFFLPGRKRVRQNASSSFHDPTAGGGGVTWATRQLATRYVQRCTNSCTYRRAHKYAIFMKFERIEA